MPTLSFFTNRPAAPAVPCSFAPPANNRPALKSERLMIPKVLFIFDPPQVGFASASKAL